MLWRKLMEEKNVKMTGSQRVDKRKIVKRPQRSFVKGRIKQNIFIFKKIRLIKPFSKKSAPHCKIIQPIKKPIQSCYLPLLVLFTDVLISFDRKIENLRYF